MEKQYQERCHNPDHENHSMAIFRIMLICKIEIITLIYVDRQYRQTKAPLTKCRRLPPAYGGNSPLFGLVIRPDYNIAFKLVLWKILLPFNRSI